MSERPARFSAANRLLCLLALVITAGVAAVHLSKSGDPQEMSAPTVARETGIEHTGAGLVSVETGGDRRAHGVALVADPKPGPFALGAGGSGPPTVLRLRTVDEAGAPLAGSEVTVAPSKRALYAMSYTDADASLLERTLNQRLSGKRRSERPEGPLASGVTDGSGYLSLALAPEVAVYEVTLKIAGSNNGTAEVAALPRIGETVNVGTIALEPRACIVCTIFGPDGEPDNPSLSAKEILTQGGGPVPSPGSVEHYGRLSGDSPFPPTHVQRVLFKKAGTYRLFVRMGYPRKLYPGPMATVELGQTAAVEFHLPSLPPPDLATFSVEKPAGTPAFASVSITVEGDRKFDGLWTDERGQITVGRRALQNTEVVMQAADLDQRYLPVERLVSPPYDDSTLTLAVGQAVHRTVRVVNSAGELLPDATLAIQARGTERVVDAEALSTGRSFELDLAGEPGETFSLAAAAPDHASRFIEDVSAAEVSDPWVIELAALPTLGGRVVLGNEPVEGALVRIASLAKPGKWLHASGAVTKANWGAATVLRTDANGAFRATAQRPGPVAIQASTASGHSTILIVDPAHENTGDLILTLEAGGSVSGEALESDVRKIGPAHVVVAAHRYFAARVAEIDSDRRYAFPSLPPGDWELFVQSRHETDSWFRATDVGEDWDLSPNVTVVAGLPTTFNLVPPPSTLIQGRIILDGVDADWKGTETLRLYAEGEDPTSRSFLFRRECNVATDGSFEIWAYADTTQSIRLFDADTGLHVTWTHQSTGDLLELVVSMATLDLTIPDGYTRASIATARETAESPAGRVKPDFHDGPRRRGIRVVAGTISLRITGNQAKTLRRTITVKPGEIRAITLE